ncbi:MAG: hypothetical protein NZ551_06260 [Microscillaceae bacterium]|nr:hypothetical protein [Microscillaceae bacterium]MDW8460798.1 hypothetical protein [Cytophagales bacterium]
MSNNRTNAIQQPTEVLLQEIELENQIRNLLNDTQIYFDYNTIVQNDGNLLVKLDLITINKEHNQKFLFHSIQGKDKVSILEEMIAYIDNYKRHLEIYEIEWLNLKAPNPSIQTSWFRGNDIFDVLHKFYYDKEKSQFKIFKIKLMPMA